MGDNQSEVGLGEDHGMQSRRNAGFTRFTRHAAGLLAMVVFVGIGILFLWEMVTLILTLFLSTLFAIFLRWLTNHVVRRSPLGERGALLVVVVVMLAVVGGASWLMAPAIADQFSRIGAIMPVAFDEVEAWVEQTSFGPRLLEEISKVEWTSFFGDDVIGQVGGAFFGGLGFVSNAALVLVVGVYLAFDPDVYRRGLIRMVPMHYRARTEEILDVLRHQLVWWLMGRFLAMLAVAVIVAIGLWVLGIPLPFTLGLIAGLFSFVPILGSIVSFLPAALIALLSGPEYILWAGLVFMGAQAIEGNFLTPVVQKHFVSLPHAMTLISQVIGGILFGVIGVTVATPLAVLLMALINMMYVEDVLGDRTPYSDLVQELKEEASERGDA